MRRALTHISSFRVALAVIGAFAAIAVTGASAADFEKDFGQCPEPPGGGQLLRCPTAFVGEEYEVEMESEEGSGCTSPGNPYVWYEVANSSLPPGLTMTRAGVISGTPTHAGFYRFWVWNHDLTHANGGPEWCQREDRSEVEFSIFVDPGLEIVNEAAKPATLGQPYTDTLAARQVVILSPPTGSDVQATWSVLSGALPPGINLSASGALSGTPTTEGSYQVDIRAQHGGPMDTETFTLSVRQAVTVTSPFASRVRPGAEVGLRLGKTAIARGGSGTYTWSIAPGALPAGLSLNTATGAISGTPRAAGRFAFGLTATDSEGRAATEPVGLIVAPKLTISTRGLGTATVGRTYRTKLATTGGARPLSWKVSGKLPPGVRFVKSAGALVGTPSKTGTFRLKFEARDALGAKAQKALVLVVES